MVPLKAVNRPGVYADEYQTVPILSYHRFGPGGGKMVISPASFAAQLDWLARNDYRVIPLSQLVGYLAGKEMLPRRAVVITIDDGYESTSAMPCRCCASTAFRPPCSCTRIRRRRRRPQLAAAGGARRLGLIDGRCTRATAT